MRVTKKMLRTAKESFNRRMRELVRMSEDELLTEVKRAFPSVEHSLDQTHKDRLQFMLADLMELCIPSHWCD